MKRIIMLLILPLMLSGCWFCKENIKEVYVDKYIPIVIVPKPPPVNDKKSYVSDLTMEQKNDIGELSKAYVISTKELSHSKEQYKKVYDTYVDLAARSASRLKAIENLGGNVDNSFLKQFDTEVQGALQSLTKSMEKSDERHELELDESLRELNIDEHNP